MASKQGPSTENEHWEVVTFDGADTLCLARFVQHIVKKVSIYKQCVVFIEGDFRKFDEKAKIVARPLKGEVDGYVRNITVREIPSARKRTVGCRVATLEDIKADTVSFFFFGLGKELHAELANSPFEFYLRKQKEGLTRRDLDLLIKHMMIQLAITTAKLLKDKNTGDIIKVSEVSSFLENKKKVKKIYGLDVNEMYADGFRVFESDCASYANNAKRATNILIDYVESSLQHSPLPNAIIYAIESLGCVTKDWDETRYMLGKFLEKVLSNVSQRKRKGRTAGDIVWASLVALENTKCQGFSKRILNDPEIKKIIKQHRFKYILQAVLKEVTKGKFANERSVPESPDIHPPAPGRPEEQEADHKHPHSYFLSYSRKNKNVVDHVELILRRQKQDVQRDENDIRPGDKLDDRIKAMINSSDTFIAFWSKAYDSSDWCCGELDYAMDFRKKPKKPSRIVLLALDQTERPIRFSDYLYLNGKSRKDRELAVQRVVEDEATRDHTD